MEETKTKKGISAEDIARMEDDGKQSLGNSSSTVDVMNATLCRTQPVSGVSCQNDARQMLIMHSTAVSQ